MLNALKNLFSKGAQQQAEEQKYLSEHHIQFDAAKGYIVNDIVLNEALSERLEYFSNRRLKKFDDLEALYFAGMMINEKVDLEIATGQYVARLGNTQENLLEFKAIVQNLNQYYRQFKRDQK